MLRHMAKRLLPRTRLSERRVRLTMGRQHAAGAGRTGVRPPAMPARAWLAVAVLALAGLAVLDAFDNAGVAITGGMYLLLVLAVALVASWREVATAAVLATVLVAASGAWNHNAGSSGHVIRIIVVALGGRLGV